MILGQSYYYFRSPSWLYFVFWYEFKINFLSFKKCYILQLLELCVLCAFCVFLFLNSKFNIWILNLTLLRTIIKKLRWISHSDLYSQQQQKKKKKKKKKKKIHVPGWQQTFRFSASRLSQNLKVCSQLASTSPKSLLPADWQQDTSNKKQQQQKKKTKKKKKKKKKQKKTKQKNKNQHTDERKQRVQWLSEARKETYKQDPVGPTTDIDSQAINIWSHYENTPIQIYRKFHLQKLKIFR